jgi:hypothetical protein
MAALIGISVKPKAAGGSTATVPLDLLSQDGVPPETGDKVSFQAEATVKSVTDTDATLSLTSINGEPVAEEAGEGPSDDESAEPDENTPLPPGGGAATAPAGRAATAGLGAALRKGARGRPMPF